MNQSDFALLAAIPGEPEESPQSSYAEVHSCKQSVELQHVKCEDKMEEVSTNCISNALYGFVGEWEVPTMNLMSSSDGMDIDAASISKEMFEPTRRVTDFAPPKRFYRIFWRSASRRILALSSSQTK